MVAGEPTTLEIPDWSNIQPPSSPDAYGSLAQRGMVFRWNTKTYVPSVVDGQEQMPYKR